MTREGFLICRNVVIARTGEQMYLPTEVPVKAGPSGIVVITRDPEEVFHPDAMESFEGKPFVILHPNEAVTPQNWKQYTVGHAYNIRKGAGLESDTLIADLMIFDEDAILTILSGHMREVSCGYNCDYEEIEPGRGRQVNIRGNHIALVNKARCGTLCSIKDQKPEEGGDMKLAELVKKLFPSLTADEQKEVRDAVGAPTGDGAPAVVVVEHKPASTPAASTMDAAVDARFKGIETAIAGIGEALKKLTADADKDKELEGKHTEKTVDCNTTKDAETVQDILYRTSILAPDVKYLTADAATTAKDRKTFDEACCMHKRKALISAFGTTDGKEAIAPFVRDAQPDFLTMDCSTADTAFIGASELIKRKNTMGIKPHVRTNDFQKTKTSPASLNKQYAEFWKTGGK